ncbi:MAG: radical SAM protein [Clostridia bacterium]|nr:radical SAM protein [Clostridia bacterium]
MRLLELLYVKYRMKGVSHATLNPEGPGAVRIHLIPPKFSIIDAIIHHLRPESVAIINGQDIIPLSISWAILLNNFLKELNYYSEEPITKKDIEGIINSCTMDTTLIYPSVSQKELKKDLKRIIDCLYSVATGNGPTEDIGYRSLGEYAPFMSAPHRMDLMISSMEKDGIWNCNQRCIHCYAAGQIESNVKELSTEEWKIAIDKLREIGIPQITFTGGEPTVRKDLVELVDYAKWFVTRLNTNGILLTKELCKKLYEASLDSVQVTLYSSNPVTHNRLVRANTFDKTWAGIQNAIEAGLNISINTPLCSFNADEYEDTLEALHKIGVRYVSCSGLIITGNAKKSESTNTQLTETQITHTIVEAANYCHTHGMELSFTSPGWVDPKNLENMNLNPPTCGACLSNMAIAPNGDIIPCQSWLNKADVLGNILSSDWKDVWNRNNCVAIRDYASQDLGKCPFRETYVMHGVS